MQLAVPAQYLNLDPSLYTSPATWQAERAQIFLRTWQFMGPASAVAAAGQYLTLDIAGFGVFAIGHTLMSNTGVVRSLAGDLRVGLGRSS